MGLSNLRKTIQPKCVQLPNKKIIKSSHDVTLDIPNLSSNAKEATIFPEITNSSLLSIGKLCDDDCEAIFTKQDMKVVKDNKIILAGKRNTTDGLWDVDLTPQTVTPNECANAIVQKKQSKQNLASYYHQSCFSPCIRTFTEAIKNGNFDSWPGLNDLKLYNHMTRTLATSMGHLDQQQQGLQSTKQQALNFLLEQELHSDIKNDFFPKDTGLANQITNDCVAQIVPFSQTNKAYMDLTGRFPHISSSGNEYVLVVYDYDSNAILAEAIPNRQAAVITEAWLKIHNVLKKRGVAPNLYLLDNEISADLKWAMTKNEIDWQLATPYQHRANAAERAIRTFKNHFIAGLSSVHPDFPIKEWDRLIPQAVLTLNLLRNSRVNPKLSSYAYLHGPFNFNSTPLAPPGTLVAIHVKPNNRASWAPHSKRGFYVGPCLNHYRNFQCYVPDTNSVVVTDTVDFIATQEKIPTITHEDFIHQSLMDILATLQSKPKTNIPSLQYGEEINDAIIAVSNILNKNTPKSVAVHKLLKPIDPPEEGVVSHVQHVLAKSNEKIEYDETLTCKCSKKPRVKSCHCSEKPRVTHSLPNYKALATQYLTCKAFLMPSVNHIFDENGKKETLDTLLKRDPLIWGRALSNEWGRLANGNKYGVIATNTIEFILKEDIPPDCDITYATFVCDRRPLKPEPFRVRIVVGGDGLTYGEDSGSPATDLLETKILINSTISDASKGARFMSADLKDYFLGSPMKKPEYMKVHIRKFSDDIIQQYDLHSKMDENGYVYIKINKGMYGLKQAALLAYNRLVKLLQPHGYYPEPNTNGIWSHNTKLTKFCLCVDDFGIKYFSTADAQHLLNALTQHYKISTDWQGHNYCGLSLHWNYKDEYVDVSMPGYVAKQLERYQHPRPAKAQYAPHRWSLPSYGQTPKSIQQDMSTKLDIKDTKLVQSISGAFLFYGRAVDPTILPALTEIASQQAQPTVNTMSKCKMLMDYLYTYPNAVIRYKKSKMILYVDSDAAYLVLPKARSRVAGHYFLGDAPPPSPNRPNHKTTNGPIHTVCKGLRNVVSSAAEAETGAAFHNSKQVIIIRRLLDTLGHPQHVDGTPFKMDNAVTTGFIYDNIKRKQSKTWDMNYNWMRDKEVHKLIRYYWDKGVNNDADYFSKHHPPKHHIQQRPKYILKGNLLTEKLFHICHTFFHEQYIPDTCRGCVAGDPPYRSKVTRVSRLTSHGSDVFNPPLRHRLQ